jgi:hypothetical protein
VGKNLSTRTRYRLKKNNSDTVMSNQRCIEWIGELYKQSIIPSIVSSTDEIRKIKTMIMTMTNVYFSRVISGISRPFLTSRREGGGWIKKNVSKTEKV